MWAHHTAHVDLNWAQVRALFEVHLALARGAVGQAQAQPQLVLARRVGDVDLVAQDQKRHRRQRII